MAGIVHSRSVGDDEKMADYLAMENKTILQDNHVHDQEPLSIMRASDVNNRHDLVSKHHFCCMESVATLGFIALYIMTSRLIVTLYNRFYSKTLILVIH